MTSSVADVTKDSIVAGYTKLKTRLIEKMGSRYPRMPMALTELEASPHSKARQAVLIEEITATRVLHDQEIMDLAHKLLESIQTTSSSSQIIHHVQNSAISNFGSASTYNIQGDQHNTYASKTRRSRNEFI